MKNTKIIFKNFTKWALNRFGEDNVIITDKEIKINSIFEPDDTGYHLWCNPSGGKKKREYGVFHCWKKEKQGDLAKLIQIVDECSRQDAIDKLGGKKTMSEIEKEIEDGFFGYYDENEVIEPIKSDLLMPPACELISNLGTNNWWRKKAEEYLNNRKIPIDGLYICINDKYKSRIVIPYYDKTGKLIYWNCRHIGKSKCKYLGPPKETGFGKDDVIFMARKWANPGETLYICEGEFNAISLSLAEFNAAACGGKNMSEKQALLVSGYKNVLCLDRDKAGKAGTTKMSSIISSLQKVQKTTKKLMFVIPPPGYNDWNEFLIKNNAEMLHYYILKNTKPLDYSGPLGTIGDYFGYSDIWN